MKKYIKLISILTFIFSHYESSSQSIRKDYREMTALEVTDFQAAMQSLSTVNKTRENNFNVIQEFGEHHRTHFSTNIHSIGSGTDGRWFLTWHREFMYEFEWFLKKSKGTQTEYLSLPYWNYITDNGQQPNWKTDIGGVANSGLLSPTAIGNFVYPVGGTATVTTDRNTTISGLPTITSLNAAINKTDFWTLPNFHDGFDWAFEQDHNTIHGVVGGAMGGALAAYDPVFYLFHTYMDKVWQDRTDDRITPHNNFYPSPNAAVGTTGMVLVSGISIHEHYSDITPNDVMDSRSLPNPEKTYLNNNQGPFICDANLRNWDVWYASNKKVVLNGTKGSAFVCSDNTRPYVYRYAAATTYRSSVVTGDIYVGDLKRDVSDNVIADNNGGFTVNSGVQASFLAGGSVILMPGFEAKSGSIIDVHTIVAANGSRIRSESTASKDNANSSDEAIKINMYPNPNSGVFSVVLERENENVEQPETSDVKLTIYNMLGENVYTSKAPINKTKTINLTDRPKGIYFIKVESEGRIKCEKILIE